MAVGKPATKECFQCHHRYPVTYMAQRTVKVNTGNSGMSMSIGLSKNRNPRVNSGRQYYRNKTVWICGDCIEANKLTGTDIKAFFFVGILILLLVGAFTLFIKFPNGFEEPLFDNPVQEQTINQ